ncbi:heterokaryon incompatibility protein-domain-containing protein [Xylariaceae sp. AK1471]|nr:heterokaryon incompatibility protein-domain-containing protein [Xylariaceae sp. AK1471]
MDPSDHGQKSSSEFTGVDKSDYLQQSPREEWNSRKKRRDSNLAQLGTEMCDICRQINWHPILLDCCPDRTKHRFPYRWANIPTFRQMETRQQYCSFCRLCLAVRGLRTSLQHSSLSDAPLQLVYYAGNLRYRRRIHHSATDAFRRKNLERAKSMGFRLFVQHAGLGSWTIHLNMDYIPSPIFQLMPAAEEVPRHRKRRSGQRIPATEADPTLFRRWVDNCKSKHGTMCDIAYFGFRKTEWAQLAEHLGYRFRFRLIDVWDRKIIDAPEGCSYVALSYVWGQLPGVFRAKKNDIKATINDSGAAYLEIPKEGVPKTVQDAMRVTAMLGERFLWVDALCIIQDDVEELAATLRAMDMIYAAANITIVAASGTNAMYGLPGALPRSRQTSQPTERVYEVTMLLEAQSLSEVLDTSCWRTRAWTYQEEYFSTRLLIFSDNYVYFKCRVEDTCEDIAIEDGGVQSYFLESGPTSAVWLRAQDRSSSEESCSYNAESIAIESRGASLSRLMISTKRPLQIDAGERYSDSQLGKDTKVGSSSSYSPISHGWRDSYRSWLEEQSHYSRDQRPLQPAVLPSTLTTEDFVPAIEGRDSARLNTPHRRRSVSDFTHRAEDYGTPSTSSMDRPRSSGPTVLEATERKGEYQFRFAIPLGVDDNPFSRQSKSLVGWMTSKLNDNYESDNDSENGDKPETPNQIFHEYTATVVTFTQRSLTKQSDILNAFQGIMNHFERLMGAGFICGLPLAAFDAALLWKDEGDWMEDWTNQWNPTLTGYGTTYAHEVERREWHEGALKARLGNGCVRNSVVDCDKFPTWSWCGWKGPVSYYHDNGAVSELKGEITWPWKPEYTSPPNESISMQRKSVLQVEAWIASVDLAVLRSLKIPDTFWGWPTENGQRVRDGVFECLLLSTGIDRESKQLGIEAVPTPFCNIMILGIDDSGGAVYRRGIAQMYVEDWEMFGPHIKLPGTGSLAKRVVQVPRTEILPILSTKFPCCLQYLAASIWLGGREGGTSF